MRKPGTHQWLCLYATLLLVALSACGGDSDPSSSPPTQNPPGTYNYQLIAEHTHPLDTADARYVLWFRMRDGSWRDTALTSWSSANGSLTFQGKIKIEKDSVLETVVSIERNPLPALPSAKVMAGAFDTARQNALLSASSPDGMGDYSTAAASVLLTTRSMDTARAGNEFYLMQDSGGTYVSSVTGLGVAPQGWQYALWVVDSNFFPSRRIFYGTFDSASGPDSSPANDAYPFPGGYNPAPLNDPGARVLLTLQPSWATGPSQEGPFPFTMLYVQLARYLYFNETLPMKNSWQDNIPAGTLTLY